MVQSVKIAIAALIAVGSLGLARVAREAAKAEQPADHGGEPYAPSPSSAPIVALGYREVAADLLFVRLAGYFGGEHSTATGIAALAEAIVALDPDYQKVYDWGARAMTLAHEGVDNTIYLRAIRLLEAAARQYPKSYKYPLLAGQMYLLDLSTTDRAQRRTWDELGTQLLEIAVHKPGASAEAATTVATMRTKLGQHQRAADGLREMLLLTSDDNARRRLIEKLAALENADADEIAAELLEERGKFERAWQAERPAVPSTMYLLIGPRLDQAPFALPTLRQ